jgi:hypothetical protein
MSPNSLLLLQTLPSQPLRAGVRIDRRVSGDSAAAFFDLTGLEDQTAPLMIDNTDQTVVALLHGIKLAAQMREVAMPGRLGRKELAQLPTTLGFELSRLPPLPATDRRLHGVGQRR